MHPSSLRVHLRPLRWRLHVPPKHWFSLRRRDCQEHESENLKSYIPNHILFSPLKIFSQAKIMNLKKIDT